MTSLADLDDSTAFERFALEAAAALQPSERRRRGVFDLRTKTGTIYAYAASILGGDGEKLRLDLRPLMFGAAWKILDQVVEFTIGAPRNKIVQTPQKVYQARSCPPPTPFDSQPDLWSAIINTYDNTQELRNGLIHRQAEVTTSRELRVRNRHTSQVDALDADQQLAFCRLSQRVISCILKASADDRDLFDISDQLRRLTAYSKYNSVVGRDSNAIFELVVEIEVRDGMARVDAPELLRRAREKFSDAVYVDLIGYVEGSETAVLTGPLEAADPQVYEFRITDPPAWLSRETRLTT